MGSNPIPAGDLAAAVDDLKQLIVNLHAKTEEKLIEIQKHMATSERDQELKNNLMSERLDRLEDRIRVQEDRSRRNNLLFRGIEEPKAESWAEAESTILDFGTYFALFNPNNPPKFDRVHRLGTYRQGQCRPIIARFTQFKDKSEILFKAKNLKGSSFNIAEDFSAETRQIRRELYPFLMEARSKGKKASYAVDKLKIEGKQYELADLKKSCAMEGEPKLTYPPDCPTSHQNKDLTQSNPTNKPPQRNLPSKEPSQTKAPNPAGVK